MSEKDQEENLKDILDALKAYSHDLRARMILLLNIYGELSLSELTEKVKESKPTVSRHAKILKDLNFIKFNKGDTHGNIIQHKYSLNRKKLKSISGLALQKITDTKEFYQATLAKLNAFTALFRNLRWISEAAVRYIEKMTKEVENNSDDRMNMNLINLDNLGEISFFYLTKNQMKALAPVIEQFNKDLGEILRQSDDSEPKPYLLQRTIMPIEHLLQSEETEEWIINGKLWDFYYDDDWTRLFDSKNNDPKRT